jgi:sedoheptulose-bisphosphatase
MSSFIAEDNLTPHPVSSDSQLVNNSEKLLTNTNFVEYFSNEIISLGLPRLLSFILTACDIIGFNLRNSEYSSVEIGSVNSFGDSQLDVDVKCDDLIFRTLKLSKLVAFASSEENPVEIVCDGDGFCVSFDPLDGSSIIDANFAVGSIFGIWKGNESVLGRTGRSLIASIIVQYGPRLTAMVGLSKEATSDITPLTFEMTHTADHGWIISVPKVIIAPTSKIFAPGNLRAVTENAQYKALVDYWINNNTHCVIAED